MESIIEKINKKGQEARMEETRRILSEKESFDKKLETIKGFGERISKMWDIAQSLLDNGFSLGYEQHDACGFPMWTLETNGINHGIGFFVKRKFGQLYGTVIYFGIEGGGWDGMSFYVDKNGVADIKKNTFYVWNEGRCRGAYYQYPHYINKVKNIINGFDAFEKEFYEYVEKILS